MSKQEEAQIILEVVDEAYSVPSYLEDRVKGAIVDALIEIERRELERKKKEVKADEL